jgi:hypothetical protein
MILLFLWSSVQSLTSAVFLDVERLALFDRFAERDRFFFFDRVEKSSCLVDLGAVAWDIYK